MRQVVQLAAGIEFLSVQVVQRAGIAVANHPRLALWAGGVVVVWQVTS